LGISGLWAGQVGLNAIIFIKKMNFKHHNKALNALNSL